MYSAWGATVTMLAHCVNPDCVLPLRSFAEGRLFQFEIVSISVAANDAATAPFDEKPQRQTAHFWLCGRCAEQMTLLLDPAAGLRVVQCDPTAVEFMDEVGIHRTDNDPRQANSC